MRPAARAQNMNASSASGLCASRIVRGGSDTTLRGTTCHLRRLFVKRVQILRMLGVFGPLARSLPGFVFQEVRVRPSRPGALALEVERAGPEHEPKQVGGYGAADRVRLRQGRRRVSGRQLQ